MTNLPGKKFSFRFLWYDFSFSLKKSSVGFSNTRWSKMVLWIILFFSIFHCNSEQWKTDNWKYIITSDGIGYYSYLPAVFIYHDFSYKFMPPLAQKYDGLKTATDLGFCNSFNGKLVNKYFIGPATALTPFFLVANYISGSEENPRDGYSFYYAALIGIGAIFYALMGLASIRLFLLRFKIKEGHVALVLLCLFFGTNLFRYALAEQLMSHVYSFGFISCFVLQLHILLEKFTTRRFFFAAFLFGFIIILRPINAFVLLSLPFLAGDRETLKLFFKEIFSKPLRLIPAASIVIAVILIQLISYYAQCGKLYVYAYSKEGFDFLHPHFFRSLFSYSNGFFVYAPVMFVSLFGLLTFLPDQKFRVVSFLIFFVILNWIISSWWQWTYSGAFGMRPFVEYFAFFGLLLGLLLQKISKRKIAGIAFIVLILIPLTGFCQLQLWQFKNGIISYGGMTKEKYWLVFLETRRQFYYINVDGGPPPIPENAKLIFSDSIDYEKIIPGEDWRSITTEKAFSGTHSICLKTGNNHAPRWKKRIGDILTQTEIDSGKFLCTGKMKWLLEDNGSDARVTISLMRNGEPAYYDEEYVIHQVQVENKWIDFKWNVEFPKLRMDDTIEIYARRDNWDPVYVDDLTVQIYRK